MTAVTWGAADFPLLLTLEPGAPATLALAPPPTGPAALSPHNATRAALAEVLLLGQGRSVTSTRTDRTAVADRLRPVEHRTSRGEGVDVLEIDQRDPITGLLVTTRLERSDGLDAYRATTRVRNEGTEPQVLQAVSSVQLTGLTGFLGPADQTHVWTGRNEWCAESRWSSVPLDGPEGLPDMNSPAHHQAGRGMHARTATSTWSSGEWVPAAVLTGAQTHRSLMWQLEVNGPWRWELNSQFDRDDWLTLVLLGPTDLNHGWSLELAPGEAFTTIPVSFALSDAGLEGAVAAMTHHRRRSQRVPDADAGRPLIYNDYMNALMGDPTTEKLLPLIDAAAEAGAQYFCIDAGWYDDGGNWWPSVGAWEPSTRRFGETGLTGVLEHIRLRGMRPGLWVEPEVIGVRSPRATELPEDAFMHRLGRRIVEHDRYFLDLRSVSARTYLDEVFDRLVGQYGARYFKLDYNVTPGTGPDDAGASSPGVGLLDHARAHLTWFEELRKRHPQVVFEACSSGAQRMDQAMLELFDLQSTSDQQDYRLYPTIAAAAPMAMAPEQAGNWAYPQGDMTLEQVAFTLVTGLSGRMYLSGHLNELDDERLALVREAATVYPAVMAAHAVGVPIWPLGLPAWDDPVVAVGTAGDDGVLLAVWVRADDAGPVRLPVALSEDFGEAVVETVFPSAARGWKVTWDTNTGEIIVDATAAGESARLLRLRRERKKPTP